MHPLRNHNYLVQHLYRGSHRGCSVKKGVLRNFAKFTGKHLRQRLWKVSGIGVFLWILRNFAELLQATASENRDFSRFFRSIGTSDSGTKFAKITWMTKLLKKISIKIVISIWLWTPAPNFSQFGELPIFRPNLPKKYEWQNI